MVWRFSGIPQIHPQIGTEKFPHMNVNGKPTRTIWLHAQNPEIVQIIDQRCLPHSFVVEDLRSVDQVARAIQEMHVRGAGLIGATAGFGMYLAALEAATDPDADASLLRAASLLKGTRPTAVNLAWAVDRMLRAMPASRHPQERISVAKREALMIAEEDAAACQAIGLHGLPLLENLSQLKNGAPLQILTHCNAGWLAFVDFGSATSPIYAAHDRGIPVHVWVDETRPRCQGSKLTAWELGQHGVPHTLIADNTGGHLMQHGQVDLVIVGTDRTTRTGDVANKIGTYLKALAAWDNGIPFYVALPSSSFDWSLRDGLKEIPIEERGSDEVKYAEGLAEGRPVDVLIAPPSSPAANYGFDVTPARLITGLITERGVCRAAEADILGLFPEFRTKK